MRKVFTKNFNQGETIIIEKTDRLEYLLWGPRMLFFENVGKGKDDAFYSEGTKWEKIVEFMKSNYGLERGLGGIFHKDLNIDDKDEIVRLLSLSEVYMKACKKLDESDMFDYSGGDGLLISAEEFTEDVHKKTTDLFNKLEKDLKEEGYNSVLKKLRYEWKNN